VCWLYQGYVSNLVRGVAFDYEDKDLIPYGLTHDDMLTMSLECAIQLSWMLKKPSLGALLNTFLRIRVRENYVKIYKEAVKEHSMRYLYAQEHVRQPVGFLLN